MLSEAQCGYNYGAMINDAGFSIPVPTGRGKSYEEKPVPLRRIIQEQHITPEVAQAMHAAFNKVNAAMRAKKISSIKEEWIARRIFDGVMAGKTDASVLADSIIADIANNRPEI